MTSRERLRASIAHRPVDRVPVDLGSTPSSGISAQAYNRLKTHLGVRDDATRVYDVVQQLAMPGDWALTRFGVDVIDVARGFVVDDTAWYDVLLEDGSSAQYPLWFRPERESDGAWYALNADGVALAKMPPGGTFFDQLVFPYVDGYPDDFDELPQAMSQVLWAALAHSPWDRAAQPGFWNELRKVALRLQQQSDRALMLVCGCNLFEWGTFLRRMDHFLMDLVEAQDQVEAMLDALMAIHLETLAKVCESIGDIVDIIRFGDDLGMDANPFMAPEVYRSLFKPRHAVLCDYVKRHSQMHTFLHSCGSIYDLIPDLIDAGFEILNPVQTSARKMDPRTLKQEFGRDVCFWGGGCDTRKELNRGTPDSVRRHVLERLDIMSAGSGFVFNTVHNILPDTPPENIVAMFEAVAEFNGRL